MTLLFSWPHCVGTLPSPEAAAGWLSLSPPPDCSHVPAGGTPDPQSALSQTPEPRSSADRMETEHRHGHRDRQTGDHK